MAALEEVLISCGGWFSAKVSACLYVVIVPFVC